MAIQGICEFTTVKVVDERGCFQELFVTSKLPDGVTHTVNQANLSTSERNVVRGMHYRADGGEAKLITVLRGAVLQLNVDARIGSPTFGHVESRMLSGEDNISLFVPPGILNGFATTSTEPALYHYLLDREYKGGQSRTVNIYSIEGLMSHIQWAVDPKDIIRSQDDFLAPNWNPNLFEGIVWGDYGSELPEGE